MVRISDLIGLRQFETVFSEADDQELNIFGLSAAEIHEYWGGGSHWFVFLGVLLRPWFLYSLSFQCYTVTHFPIHCHVCFVQHFVLVALTAADYFEPSTHSYPYLMMLKAHVQVNRKS